MTLLRWIVVLLLFSPIAQGAGSAPTLVVLGDSLSAGYGLPRGAGWVNLLAQRLRQQGYPHRVVNASISGDTTLGGRNRLATVLSQNRPAWVLIELGANDGLRGQPVDLMKANLEAMVRQSKAQQAAVMLIGMRLPPNYGAAYGRDFTQVFKAVSTKHNVPLVPFLMEGFAQSREMFLSDGIHPAAAAQPLILDTIWKTLGPLLGK